MNESLAKEDLPPTALKVIYCIDTSALVNMVRRYGPMNARSFRPLWDRVETLVSVGRLIAPEEVRREIEPGQDELVDWIHQHPELCVASTPDLVEMTTALVRKYRIWPGSRRPGFMLTRGSLAWRS